MSDYLQMPYITEGSIRQRKGGRLELRIRYKTDPNSPYITKSIYGESEKELKRKLEEFKYKLIRGEANEVKGTLSKYIENWLYTYKIFSIKPASFDRLESIYNNHIKSEVGDRKIEEIRADDIQKLINLKSQSMSFSSTKKIYELLNGCFNHAVANGDLRKNPMTAICLPKRDSMPIQTKEIQIYSTDDVLKIINEVNYSYNSSLKYRYSPIWIFILNTGIRIGEALALTWDKVDFTTKTVKIDCSLSCVKNRSKTGPRRINKITTTKTKCGRRSIPLNTMAIEALCEIRKRNEEQKINSDFVICDKYGKHENLRNVQISLERLCKSCRIACYGIHALRHTFASNALRTGIDIKVLSVLLGHSSTVITYNSYIHIIEEQKSKAVDSILDSLRY